MRGHEGSPPPSPTTAMNIIKARINGRGLSTHYLTVLHRTMTGLANFYHLVPENGIDRPHFVALAFHKV